MTKEQALQLLDELVKQIPLKREDHFKVMEALRILQGDLQKPAP